MATIKLVKHGLQRYSAQWDQVFPPSSPCPNIFLNDQLVTATLCASCPSRLGRFSSAVRLGAAAENGYIRHSSVSPLVSHMTKVQLADNALLPYQAPARGACCIVQSAFGRSLVLKSSNALSAHKVAMQSAVRLQWKPATAWQAAKPTKNHEPHISRELTRSVCADKLVM